MNKIFIIIGIISIVFGVIFSSCNCNKNKYVGKHRFGINKLVNSRFSEDKWYLILDTLRDAKGRPSYEMLDIEEMVLDVELSYTNKIEEEKEVEEKEEEINYDYY